MAADSAVAIVDGDPNRLSLSISYVRDQIDSLQHRVESRWHLKGNIYNAGTSVATMLHIYEGTIRVCDGSTILVRWRCELNSISRAPRKPCMRYR